ncbi:hypothetical protein EON80_06940 [bacterium]|nr:MAG: hypothetical protein EON80_06940 [bacterium]
MNYDSIKSRLETAHSILINSGDELDLQNLAVYASSMGRKDWRTAISCLEETGASAMPDPAFWRELLEAAKELELPRYQARIEKQLGV